MNDIEEAIKAAASKTVSLDEALRNIFIERFGLQVTEGEVTNAGFMAYGMLAVDTATRIANIFLSLQSAQKVRSYSAICDLSFGLTNNDFWNKNAVFLMPVITMALNAHRDGVELLAERQQRNEYSSRDALVAACRAMPLEVFVMVAYCLGGPALMASASLGLKNDLAPYFLG